MVQTPAVKSSSSAPIITSPEEVILPATSTSPELEPTPVSQGQEVSTDDDVFTTAPLSPKKKVKKRRVVYSEEESDAADSVDVEVVPPALPPKPVKSAIKHPRSFSQGSSSNSGNQSEYIFKGPKKTSDILGWLEGEFMRKNLPRAYR